MNNKSITRFAFPFFLILSIIVQVTAQEQSINEFISQIEESLERKDIPAYLESFSSEIREKEESNIKDKLNLLQMESVSLFKVGGLAREKEGSRMYLRALFQNAYSVVLETWQLALYKVDGRWQIKEKSLIGHVQNLYRIKIPSDRVEKARSVEVIHTDIKLSFKDAILFYDNIPGLETALLIIGKGQVHYSPSDPKERHQLELVYKRKFLNDRIKYAYLRFSDFFYKNNIKIKRDLDNQYFKVSQIDMNKAYSLFMKHYSRSFTIENSLSGEFLSVLPQGQEAILEFEGRKTGVCSYVYSPFSIEEINFYEWKDKKIINFYTPLVDKEKKRLFVSLGQMFDVKNYQIDIDFNPKQSYLSGKAKIEVESKVGSLDVLKFKFSPELDILRIYDEERRELFYTKDKLRSILYIHSIHSIPINRVTSIEIFYRGKLVPPKQISDVMSAPQFSDNIVLVHPRYDTYLFSQSALWYPSPPDVDYFNARLKITIPREYTCVSNGELINQTQLSDTERVEEIEKMRSSVYVFKTEYPLKYLSFIVGKLTKIGEDSEILPLQLFSSSGVRIRKKELLEEAKNVVLFYESKFGPYPYEKLSIVQRIWPTAGGHSPASFIILNELYRASRERYKSKSPVNLSRWKESFIAHEIAHQWWGQCVTWKSYHDQWLAEGLAQFSAILYLKERHTEEVFSFILKKFSTWTKKKSKWGSITLGSRLSYFDFEAYQTIVYNKSSLVLNMLKDFLGEELFFKGLKEFFYKHKYSAASTNDFFQTIEEVSGKDLSVFFEKWFDSYLLPEVKVSHFIQKKGEGFILKFRINQLKEIFVFPLWTEWYENGRKTRRMFIVDERNEEFNLELRDKPNKIKINPDKAVPGNFF